MKFNKWTIGLAAVGAVSLVSVAQAEEKMNAVQTALSSTTISGYVSVSAEWNPGTGPNHGSYSFSSGKADGFNLDVVKLTIAKPLDASDEWSAGYNVDLLFGPDAVGYNPSTLGNSDSDFGIKQAYVNLRAPIGNGVEFKVGVFDTIIGYESFDAGSNPNYTRSYGYTIEPTEHTGLLATYRISDLITVSGGIANTVDAGINNRGPSETRKAYMGSIAITAPKDLGFLEGSTLYAGVVTGTSSSGDNSDNYYVGGTLATPVAGLKLGAAFDFRDNHASDDIYTFALYASFQASEKLSLHARGEYVHAQDTDQVWAATGTVQYDLWKNVISRAEIRWENSEVGAYGSGSAHNDVLIAGNLIYKF
ncbi:MAG: hypothetical protein EPO07_13775 [Verrucomicrobia bacterium]|nr:MAG: hypothetical protein EPO07_13775 [Verrucomicrobiota bacterium]